MAKILLRMAQARTNQGDDDQALALLEAEGSGRSLTVAYLNLGNAYWSKSDCDEVLGLLREGAAPSGGDDRPGRDAPPRAPGDHLGEDTHCAPAVCGSR